jgi:peptidoglycan hydrolase-like amidase
MYSAACTGKRQPGIANADGYEYASVDCAYCRRSPSAKKLAHARGLCQAGAAAMAAKGKSAEEILRHYYPGTSLRALSN